MTSSATSLHASLNRAGAGPALLMAAFDRIDDRIAALDVDLNAHPLCCDRAWKTLLPPVADPHRLNVILAQLGRPKADSPPTRPQPAMQSILPVLRRASTIAGPIAETRQPLSGATSGSAPGPGHVPGQDPSAATVDRSVRQARVATPRAAPQQTGNFAKMPGTAYSGLSHMTDPVLAAAAALRVPPARSAEARQRIDDILSGQAMGRADTMAELAALPLVLPQSLEQMARLLDQIALSPIRRADRSNDHRSGTDRGTNAGAAGDLAALPSGGLKPLRQPDILAVSASTGLARLLARGQGQQLTAAPDVRVEARGATGHHGSATPGAAPVVGPDRMPDHRLPQRPGGGPEVTIPADGSEAFARALTTLLRREARAAGIDLRGDA